MTAISGVRTQPTLNREQALQFREAIVDFVADPQDAEDLFDALRSITRDDADYVRADIPRPDFRLGRRPADRAMHVDRANDRIDMDDGTRIELVDNQISIYAPGSTDPDTVIRGRDVVEADGTTWRAESGNFILPNNAMLDVAYDGEHIDQLTVQHGDGIVEVDGMGYGDGGVSIGEVHSGGFDWRVENVEDSIAKPTYRMGGYFDGADDQDITWNRFFFGENDGRMNGRGTEAGAYVVDESMRPEFGTPDYERMLRAEVRDLYANMSGELQLDGFSEDEARTFADAYLGRTGIYDAYATNIRASELNGATDPQLLELLDMLAPLFDASQLSGGGADGAMQAAQSQMRQSPQTQQLAMLQEMLDAVLGASQELAPQAQGSVLEELIFRQLMEHIQAQVGGTQAAFGAQPQLPQMLQAVQAMQAIAARSAAAADTLGAERNVARSFIPNWQRSGAGDASELVERILRDAAPSGSTGGRLDRFDVARRSNVRPGRNDRLTHEARQLENRLAHEQDGNVVTPVAAGLAAAARTPIAIPPARTPPRVVNGPRAIAGPGVATAGREVAVMGRTSHASRLGAGIARAAGPVAVVAGAVDIGTSFAADRARGDGDYTETARAAGRTGGAFAGAWAGAKAGGAALGTAGAFVGGPVGAVVGGAVGVIGGGIAGALAGSQVGEWLMGADEYPVEGRGGELRVVDPKETAEQIEGYMSRGLTDWSVSENDARKAVGLMSNFSDDDLAAVIDEMDPEYVSRIESEMSDDDKDRYARTLGRMRDARNRPDTRLRDGELQQTVDDLTDPLNYSAVDWVVTEDESREVMDKLAGYGNRDLRRILDGMGATTVDRLMDNISDADREVFARTIRRIDRLRDQ